MKKISYLMIVAVFILGGCGKEVITTGDMYDRLPINNGDDSNTSQMVDEAYFLNGRLEEVSEDRVLIDTDEAGLVWVTLEDGLSMDLTIHSLVRVQFGGAIAESYPGQTNGHSLEVVQPYLVNPVHSFEDMSAKLEDEAIYPVVVWNTVKDQVAYAQVSGEEVGDYQVYVASLFGEDPVHLALVKGELPDLNWFYDQLQVQTSSGSMSYGPDFAAIKGADVIEGNSGDQQDQVEYDLVSHVFEDQEANVRIDYFQVADMVGELVQDYANQSLMRIVEVYGDGYRDTDISAEVLRQDGFLTIAYHGYNEAMGYEIDHFITLDMMTATELTVAGIVEDTETFKSMFLEASGYDYDTLEGVSVYLDQENFVFTFVPTDDSAERTYVSFGLFELSPILDMTFDMPPS